MIAILDIGKTNKKCLVFDAAYRVVYENVVQLPETTDEDGDPAEDLDLLRAWAHQALHRVLAEPGLDIRALNVTTYGASFVYLDAEGAPLTPLYNYLKPYPAGLAEQLYNQHGGPETLCRQTASPALGSLNSGLQLYRLWQERPALFAEMRYALHLPQYISSLLTGAFYSEITSIGCHTLLWDFQKNDYHDWVMAESLAEKFPPLLPSDTALPASGIRGDLIAGIGLHDSSAALIPYLSVCEEPFVLISTGTWCISLNPFNDEPLTPDELAQDGLCYLGYDGRAVKAARYFGGYEHEQFVRALAAQMDLEENFYQLPPHLWPARASAAYRAFMQELVKKQAHSTRLALGRSPVRRIFVDGGFSKNELYLELLAEAFPDMEVYAAEVAQATALGAALVLRAHWNPGPLPRDLIKLVY